MSNKDVKSSSHGGQRTGAGRKPDPDKKQPISLKLTPKVVKYLKSVNASVTVDEAIQRSKAYREWLKTLEGEACKK